MLAEVRKAIVAAVVAAALVVAKGVQSNGLNWNEVAQAAISALVSGLLTYVVRNRNLPNGSRPTVRKTERGL